MKRIHYTESQGMAGIPGMLPFVSASLLRIDRAQSITHRQTLPVLVDSGSTVNVLPFDIGEALGFRWENCPETPFIGAIFFDEFYVDFRKPLGYFDIALKDA